MNVRKFAYITPLLILFLEMFSSCELLRPVRPKVGEKNIISFTIDGVAGTIVGTNISVILPVGSSLLNKVPVIVISERATISPASGVAQDFTNPVTYTVTADDYTTKDYLVTVSSGELLKWAKSFGGTNYDYAYSIQQTSDGGYIMAGFVYSTDGDVTFNHGDADYWIVKVDPAGSLLWQKSLGGSSYEYANAIKQTSDSGYIVAGYSASSDGDVSANHGEEDYWIVKLDQDGNIIWEKSLGGSSYDEAYDVQQTSDGGYIVVGASRSSDGDVTGNHGWLDYWIVKLDSSGNITWEKSFGGSTHDGAYAVQQSADSGYIVVGYSESVDGNITNPHGSSDYWVIKLDSSGNMTWQKSFGGSDSELAYSVRQTTDGGYIVSGGSYSTDGDITNNHGGQDFWVIKLDSSGTLTWEKSFGGSGDEGAYSVEQANDGNYVLGGFASSSDGDVTANYGSNDYWIVKIDQSANIIFEKNFGGMSIDEGRSLKQTSDGGYIMIGASASSDGDVTDNHGSHDYWVLKLDTNLEL